jgi:hypothetical protein
MHPPYTADAEIIAIGEGILARTLPKAAWTHASHFAAALWMLRCRPDLPAPAHLPGIIRAYNEATGVANTATTGYHETITQASLAAAATHARHHPHTELYRLTNALLSGPCGDKNWLLVYWSSSLLFTPACRARWIEPDLAPFPFAR